MKIMNMKRKKLGFFDRVDADLDSGKLSPRVGVTLVGALPVAYVIVVLVFSLTGH